MFGSLGFPELMLIFGVALLIFGPRKLPDIGRSVGRALGEFRRATNDLKSTLEHEVRMDEDKDSVSALREPRAPRPATVNRGAVPNPADPAPPDSVPAAETDPSAPELEPRTATSKE